MKMTSRQIGSCTRLFRGKIFRKVWCTKRLSTIMVMGSLAIFSMCLVIMPPVGTRQEDILYLSGNLQRKLVVHNGSANEKIFGAYFQYSGNVPYHNDGYLGKKVLETIRNTVESEPAEEDKPDDHSKSLHAGYRNNFINKINVSEIPLNKSAFGDQYTLNETRSDIYDFPFTIDGRDICKDSSPFLLIMVLSVHTHIDTRSAIRNTWGRAVNPGVWPKVGVLKHKVKLVFLFGNAKNELGDKIAKEESKMYGDIVQADFEDSYFNLTYKTVTGIRWAAEYCQNVKYILKADEDVFVHVYNLVTFLSKREKKNHSVIYGHALMKSDVFREGRWAVSKQAYPLSVYPTYTCGNTYVISGKMAAQIYYTAGLLPYLNIEDVFVTGIVRKFLNGELMDVPGFTHWFEKKPKPCEFKNQIRISATKVSESLQNAIWEGLKTKEADCFKLLRVKHVKMNRPDSILKTKVIRDQHIFMNDTSGKFYIV